MDTTLAQNQQTGQPTKTADEQLREWAERRGYHTGVLHFLSDDGSLAKSQLAEPSSERSAEQASRFGHCCTCGKELHSSRACRRCGSSSVAGWIICIGWFTVAVSLIGFAFGSRWFVNESEAVWLMFLAAIPSGFLTVGFGWIVEYLANIEWHNRQSRFPVTCTKPAAH